MTNSDASNRLHSLYIKLDTLNKQRTKLMMSIVHGKPMIYGMPHEVFRKCGKKNCKCFRGQPHGPYPALSVNLKGKKKIIMIKKNDAPSAIIKSKRYKHYRQTLAAIRKINREIDSLLENLKNATTVPYP